jgi:hypothetical protein
MRWESTFGQINVFDLLSSGVLQSRIKNIPVRDNSCITLTVPPNSIHTKVRKPPLRMAFFIRQSPSSPKDSRH